VERGFVQLELLRWLKGQPRWPIRRHGRYRPLVIRTRPGEGGCCHPVYVGACRLTTHVAVGWAKGQREPWRLLSDEPTDRDTCADYGQRFTSEGNCLDDKSQASSWKARSYAMPSRWQGPAGATELGFPAGL
jgi:hypothetical protein